MIIHPIELSLYLRWVCEEFILGISNGNGLVFVLVLFFVLELLRKGTVL